MTVKEILELNDYAGDISPVRFLENYLRGNGYDGLYYEDCGCEVDNMFPCTDYLFADCECQPGYKVSCDCNDHIACEFHISPTKQTNEAQN